VLDFSSHNPPGFLVDAFVVPERVDLCQSCSNSVVFPDPNGVHGGQLRLFVDSSVAFNQRQFEQMNISDFKEDSDLPGSRIFAGEHPNIRLL